MLFRRTILSHSLRLAFATAALAAFSIDPVSAQSNATGTVYGTVTPGSGDSLAVESVATNARRSVAVDPNGKFQVTSLQPGRYRVQLLKGTTVVSSVEVEVLLGQGVEAQFAAAPVANQLQTVQVVGARSVIDVTSTNTSSTFTSRELQALPIQQNITSIMLLAPEVVKADPRYAGGASIGGGAPSENSYYINGFPVTNPLSQLGSIELPFGAIQQAQILTGGFGAEFGRSTGGVVNITTKSGSNTWQFGGSYSIEPSKLRSSYKNINYPNTGSTQNTTTDGQLYRYKEDNTLTEARYSAYVGGPIVQDKLFFFLAADQTTDKRGGTLSRSGSVLSTTLGSNGWIDGSDVNRRFLGKLDWNITDRHRVEFTTLGDNYYTDETNYSFNYATLSRGNAANYTGYYKNTPNLTTGVGGYANILKYTGNLTDELTVTALYGQSRSPHAETYNPDYSTGIPGSVFSTATGKAPGISYGTASPLSGQNITSASSSDTTRSFRFDVEYALAAHTIRAGLDENRLSSKDAGEQAAGGSTYSYRFTTTPTTKRSFGPYTYVVADGSALGNAGYYVRQRIFSDVTNARSDQSAQYIEDRWQITKKLLMTLGLRNESFKGYNQDGDAYIDSKNFISPRIGAAWDALGDSSLKVFGNLGRYSIQTPTHVAVRGAGISTLTDQYFTYTGVDANGIPTGKKALTAAPYSPDGETGQPKDANTVAARNLKPSYQDELILGMEKALSRDLTAGTKFTYRRLGNTLDDMCDDRPFTKYAADHKIDTANYSFSCISVNPGRTNDFLVDYSGTKNYTNVSLTRQDMGFDKPERKYFALDFFLEHPFTRGWYGKIAYTYSKSLGNTEGQTKSDNAQTDVSATSTWDFHEIMENAYGYLPSDRRHQIKAIGFYQLTPEWIVGGNLFAASGRPKNCNGNYGGTSPDGDYGGYGSVFFYCAGVATPRGSQGRLPWEYSFDGNVSYKPNFVKGLQVRLDIFNIFNRQSVLAIDEVHENANDPSSVLSTYGRTIAFSDPRRVRLTLQYDY